MTLRAAATLALIAGGGWLAWRALRDGAGTDAPIDLDPWTFDFGALLPGGFTIPADLARGWAGGDAPAVGYLTALSRAEDPAGDPYAKNPYSTASGLYQFTRKTWTTLGGAWGTDPTKAFGGLRPSPELQTAMARKLTDANASVLSRLGVAVNSATLYAAHIFGPSKAAKVLSAHPSTPLSKLVGASTVTINPALGTTVASLVDYLARKVGNG